MARKRDRVFSIVVVCLFLFTSLGLSLLVIWENAHPAKNTPTAASTTAASNTSSKKTTKLAGTALSGFTPVATVNSLQLTDLKVGTGAVAKASSTVTVYYTGAVASTGIIFQSTSDTGQPVSFALNQVIEGWTKGIPGMKVGGTRQLLIPANEAYGANPPSGSGIPANAPLVFNVTLLAVK